MFVLLDNDNDNAHPPTHSWRHRREEEGITFPPKLTGEGQQQQRYDRTRSSVDNALGDVLQERRITSRPRD